MKKYQERKKYKERPLVNSEPDLIISGLAMIVLTIIGIAIIIFAL